MSTKLWQRVFSVLVLAGMLVTFVRPGSALANPRIDPLANPTGMLAAAAGAVEVVYPLKADVSPALRDITPKTSTAGAVRVIPSFSLPKAETSTPDHITVAPDKPYAPNMPNPLVNFEGVHNIYGYQPPDTQGDIGPNHYVQWVNVSFAIWNKAGILLYGPADGNTLWSGFGGACENTNHGDPITLYDPLADRWFMSQFSVDGPYIQCIAVSVTPDPTGSWYRYAYIVSTTKMNDYPKFGVWPDAYYMTVNQFTGGVSWGGAGVAAFERQQMLLGNPSARMVYIDLYAGNPNYGNILPADLDGPPNGLQPPANAPGLYVEWDDSTWLPDPSDMLRVWEFHVDWTTPANSTFGANANYDPNYMIPTANVDPDMCGGSRDCIPQPGTSQHLDAIADRLMYRLQYRNFGGYQTLVTNHTVDINNTDHAGVHWFELRDTGSGWGMYQQGVWGPDADHRWMASAALDHSGNLAVGYSVSSSTTYPSARYAGRLAGDPVGTLAQGEAILAAGTGSQTSFSNRWGDYSMMGVDPTDDCTFWYTQQYYQTNSYDWRTRVGSFKFPSCSIGSTGTLNGTVTNANNSSPIPGAQVTATSSPTQTFGTTTGEAGTYAMIIPNGIYTVTASAFSFMPSTLTSVAVLSGMVTTRNFALTPAVSSLVSGVVTDANTGWPLYASVTVEGIPLAPVWTDPETGSYSITLPNGNYTFDVEAFYPGYLPETAAVKVAGPTTQDFALDVNVGTCNAPGYELSVSSLYNQDFESWPPSGWTVDSNVAGGLGWDLDSNYGDTNYTGGAGHAADVNSDANYGVPYDTELRSPAFDLSTIGVALLNYRLNYQNISTDALDVDISTNGGSTWTNLRHFTTDQGSLYATPGVLDSIDLSGYGSATNAILRWRYYTPDTSPWDWYAQVDEVRLVELDCSPQDGGLVVGNVYDANTTLPLVGADVVSDEGTSSTTIATPADPNLDDGFYFMFATTGTHEITATLGVYQPNVATVPVPHYDAIRQDFDLTAGMLSYLPDSFDVTLQMGYTATQQLTLTNAGGVAASFELKELDKGVVPLGPFEQPTNGVVKPFRQYFKTALDIKVPRPLPEAAPLAAGDVITSFVPTSNSSSPWGIAFDGSYSTVWVGEGWGTNQIFEYGPNGTPTDRSYPFTWGPSYGPADAAYNQNTGMLWSLDVVDNCIHEIDPDYGVTGNTVCPSFPTSQRGLAYDPSTDTWYTGGWNDAMVYHFDSAGVTLASYNTGLPISGLAYNPDTRHMFVMVNASPTNPVYVLDAANNFVILGQFTIAGFTAYGGAGMEFDCNGNLWAVDQASNMVYQFESGETTKMCSADVPWLSESPITGTMPSASNQIVDISFDAGLPEITQPGIYHAQLKIVHDTPYVVANLPVTLTVLAPPSMGKLNGTVTSLGYCDLDPAPLEGAVVVIEASTGVSYTLETNAAGYYSRWLNVSGGPFIVSVSAVDHTFDLVSGVVITNPGTTTVGFELRWLKPCVSAAPPALVVDVARGYDRTVALDITNGGAVNTIFKISEMPAPTIVVEAAAKGPQDARTAPAETGRSLPVWATNPEDILLTEGFEGGLVPPTGWSQDITNSGYTWKIMTVGTPYNGTYSADVEYDPALVQQDEWLLSPELVISEGTLSFWSMGSVYWCRDTYNNCDLNVWLVVGDVGGGDDVFVGTGEAVWPASWTWTQSVFNLTPLLPGGPVRIGFQYYGSDGAQVGLDVINLDGVPGNLDVPWLAESPITATIASDSVIPVDVTFTAFPTMTLGGVYTASLIVKSGDPVNSKIVVPVTMHVVAPAYGVEVSGDQVGVGGRGDVVTYTVTVTNTSNFATDSFALTLGTHVYTTSLSTNVVGPLAMGETATFVVSVVIPDDALDGEHDTVQITVTSAGDPTKTAITNVTTNVSVPIFKIYLPVIMKNTVFTP